MLFFQATVSVEIKLRYFIMRGYRFADWADVKPADFFFKV